MATIHPETIQVTSGTTTAVAYLQPDSSYSGNVQTLQYCVRAGFGDALLGQFLGGRYYSDFAGYFSYRQSSVTHGRAYDTTTLVFSDNLAYSGGGMAEQTAAFQTTYTAHCSRDERPLETLPGYLAKWNNDLYAYVPAGGGTPDAPAWWSTATDKSNADGKTWIWAQDMPQADDAGSWKMVKARTKVGVEAYIRALPTVLEKSYWSKQSKAMELIASVGKRKAPGQYAALATDWLITDGTVEEQDGYYITTIEYTGAPVEWDPDLYDEVE